MGRSPLDLDELVEHWTVLEDERALVAGKRGATRLGFALLLKFRQETAVRVASLCTPQRCYVDSHGQSEIGFGVTRLLGFDLLPRIKRINRAKLYRPDRAVADAYPGLGPAMTRPIRWEVIEENYDQMIKYATAIRLGTASTEAILRRFTRNASHPTYTAMLEVGRAQKTIFCARYLRDRDVQREIGEGLNVVESWNGANGVIAYGKGGEIASNRRDEQEMFVLCLRILQAAMVYVNTLMLQDVMGDATWADVFTPADRRGLTPLFLDPRPALRRGEARHEFPPRHRLSRRRRRCRLGEAVDLRLG